MKKYDKLIDLINDYSHLFYLGVRCSSLSSQQKNKIISEFDLLLQKEKEKNE